MELAEALQSIRTTSGSSLHELSMHRPQLVVFLRHSGCTFCRQTLSDLAQQAGELDRRGVELVLVHQGDPESASKWFAEYGLQRAHQISDPKAQLYRAFELRRASVLDILHPSVWWNGFRAAVFQGHWFGKIVGNVFQMPGVFVIDKGAIVRSYRHRLASDRPDYLELACSLNNGQSINTNRT